MRATIKKIAGEKSKQARSKTREAKLTNKVAKAMKPTSPMGKSPKSKTQVKNRSQAVKKAAQTYQRRLNLRKKP